ncbi:MAG: SCP2 sterol-binding domain-containing protein [Desulfomonilaceae bacterium]
MALESVKEVFETMPKVFAADKAAGVDAVFQFHITGKEAANWNIVMKNGACDISEGIHGNPSVSLT